MRKPFATAAIIAFAVTTLAAGFADDAEARGPRVCVKNETSVAMQARMDARGSTGSWYQTPPGSGPCWSSELGGTIVVQTNDGTEVCSHRSLYGMTYDVVVRQEGERFSCR